MAGKNLRIAFCGASGTGKTTTSKAVAEKLGFEFNPVGSRSVSANMGFASPYDVDAFGKRAEFQNQLLEEKKNWELQRNSFITDRTHFDNLAYSIMHDCVKTVSPEFIEKIVNYSRLYTHIIFFPSSVFIDVGNDPQRVGSNDYHKIYEWILKMLLDTHNFKYYLMSVSDIEERVKKVLQWVK